MSPDLRAALAARVWRPFRRDIGRKLTALGLALSLWFVLENLVIGAKVKELEVLVRNSRSQAIDALASNDALYVVVPPGLILLGRQPETIKLTVRGLRSDVEGLRMGGLIELDERELGEADEATIERPLEREVFDLRNGDRHPPLTFFRVNRERLKLEVARRASLDVNLGPPDNVATVGKLKDGYIQYTSRIAVVPSSVTLSGPKPAIDKLRANPSQVRLAPVSVDGRSSTVTQIVGLSPELLEKGVTLDTRDGRVEVTVPINADEKEVALFALPVHYRNEESLAERGLAKTSWTRTLDVIVRGPAPELAGLTPEALEKRIDLFFDWRDVSTLLLDTPLVSPATVNLSADVKVLDANTKLPPRIEYRLEKTLEDK